MRRASFAILAVLLPACASTELTTAGAQVTIDRAARPGCRLVGNLRGSAGYNGQSGDDNAAAVERWLRNEAALKGGDAVVITSRRTGALYSDSLSEPRGATSGGCPNCVEMTANVYACPASSTSSATPSPATSATPSPATSATPSAVPAQAATRATDAAPPFQADAAAAALAAAAESARRCGGEGAPKGEARVSITFARSGEPVYIEVEGAPFAGSAIGECVARKFRNARVPAFSGDARSLSAKVRLGS